MEDCLFCKIVAGEIPSEKVYENEGAYAFKDISPEAKVHVLVVPKKHYDHILDGLSAEDMSYVLDAIEHVAQEFGLDKSGFRLISNMGEDGGQTVHHLHFHILGGEKLPTGLLNK